MNRRINPINFYPQLFSVATPNNAVDYRFRRRCRFPAVCRRAKCGRPRARPRAGGPKCTRPEWIRNCSTPKCTSPNCTMSSSSLVGRCLDCISFRISIGRSSSCIPGPTSKAHTSASTPPAPVFHCPLPSREMSKASSSRARAASSTRKSPDAFLVHVPAADTFSSGRNPDCTGNSVAVPATNPDLTINGDVAQSVLCTPA